MDKNKFIELLKSEQEIDINDKLKALNYFMNNYPVFANSGMINMMNGASHKEWTSLSQLGIDITNISNPELINKAFESLRSRVDELETFK